MKLVDPSIALVLGLCIGTCFFIHGPYRNLVAYVRNVSNELNSTGKLWTNLRTTQARGIAPQYGWGWSYTSEDLSDEMKLEVQMAKRSNNQWKKNYFVLSFDKACSSVIFHSPSIPRMIYGADVVLKCPFRPIGLRRIANQSFEFIYSHFPVMPYGRYLFSVSVIKPPETVGIFIVDSTIVPRL